MYCNFKMPFVSEGNYHYGFVESEGRRFVFSFYSPTKQSGPEEESTQRNQSFLEVDSRLHRELGDSVEQFCEDYKEITNPRDFYNEFSDFVKKNAKPFLTKTWFKQPLKIAALATYLAQEMDDIEKYLRGISFETRILKIEVTDYQSRIHKAALQLSLNYKTDPITVISHDLPLQKTGICSYSEFTNIFSVTKFCEKFSELISCFQEFWSIIALIDSECWVLDPLNPTYKDVSRRIKLSDTVSVVLTFNPFCANQRPKIKLLGRQSDINHYESILQKNLENDMWDNEATLLFNLSNVLEISIPNKVFDEDPEGMDLSETGDCAICFTRELNNAVPDEVCENPTCKSLYHSTCLFMYLSSVPRNRDYFGKIQGECPNCDEIISCTIPK